MVLVIDIKSSKLVILKIYLGIFRWFHNKLQCWVENCKNYRTFYLNNEIVLFTKTWIGTCIIVAILMTFLIKVNLMLCLEILSLY